MGQVMTGGKNIEFCAPLVRTEIVIYYFTSISYSFSGFSTMVDNFASIFHCIGKEIGINLG